MDITGIGEASSAIKGVLGMFFADKTEEEKAKIAMAMQMVQSQTDTNKVEAASTSVFVAGWRPFIGWVCGSGLAFQFIVAPLGTWIASLFGHPIAFPTLDAGTLTTLLFSLLGLGGMRTAEKINGVNAGH